VGSRTAALAAGLLLVVGVACRPRNPTGELRPPEGTPEFDGQYLRAFDDDYTEQPINLSGRAPNDVIDQRLFAARLGFADIVALCSVVQVWGKGRHEQGRKEQFLDIELGEVLIGSLPKGTVDEQLLTVASEDELPGELRDKQLILFVKWAPGEVPPYHHHLMPSDDETLEYISALVEHAKAEGVLAASGSKSKRKRRPRGRKARAKAEADAATRDDGELD
jgi:hypothetical protein